MGENDEQQDDKQVQSDDKQYTRHDVVEAVEAFRYWSGDVDKVRIDLDEGAVEWTDVQVEEAAQYLYEHGIPAYAYSTEIPVAVLGAKYQWARGAGLL